MIHVTILQPPSAHVSIGSQIIYVTEGDTYDGEYCVTPNFDTQILETENKFMTDDVTVHPIPIYRTSNLQGGKTIFIGGIQNG